MPAPDPPSTRDWRARCEPFIGPLSDALRAPGGTQTLRPAQAAGLLELVEQRGLFVNGRVGVGKSLLTALAPRVLAGVLPQVRALVLCPGGILDESIAHFRKMAQHWNLPSPVTFRQLSYEVLSRMPAAGESLGDLFGPGLGPNVVICDEADALKRIGRGGSARAQQVAEWLTQHPETIFVGVTGTCDVEGLLDYAHFLDWALRDRCPVPREARQLEDWSAVIDRGELTGARWVAQDLGLPPNADLESIRDAYRRRLYGTPGIIIEDAPYTGSELVVREHVLEAPDLDPHFERLRDLWQRPDGAELLGEEPTNPDDEDPDRVHGSTIWAVARRMGRGLCYVWDPRPPEPWLAARRAYFGWVRALLQRGGALTELQARQHAIETGHPAWARWAAIAPTYTPRVRTLWLSTAALDWAAAWGAERPGVIWVDDPPWGLELARRTGWTYYGQKGKSPDGRRIPTGEGPRWRETIIASRRANGTGRNMQHRFSRCLFVAPPSTSRDFEQNVGRVHREGQPEPVTEVDILLTCAEDFGARRKLVASAERTAASLYSQKAAMYSWPYAEFPARGLRAWG